MCAGQMIVDDTLACSEFLIGVEHLHHGHRRVSTVDNRNGDVPTAQVSQQLAKYQWVEQC